MIGGQAVHDPQRPRQQASHYQRGEGQTSPDGETPCIICVSLDLHSQLTTCFRNLVLGIIRLFTKVVYLGMDVNSLQ